jgi:hypothetical protein
VDHWALTAPNKVLNLHIAHLLSDGTMTGVVEWWSGGVVEWWSDGVME